MIARIRANSEPQRMFLSTPADIAIYGGAAGGGKTLGLFMDIFRDLKTPGFNSVVFRRNGADIDKPGGLEDESKKIFYHPWIHPNRKTIRYNHINKEWRFPADTRVKFGHIQYEKTLEDWYGPQICQISFDQLEQFSRKMFWHMVGRNRSTCGIKPRMRANCNPKPDSFILKELIWWYIAPDGYPIQERSGKIRWFVRTPEEKLIWANSREELEKNYSGRKRDFFPLSFTFIPAKVTDNKDLMAADPDYYAKLMMLPLVERERQLHGNWKISEAAGNIFRKEWFKTITALPHDIDRWVRFWDLACSEVTERNPDPDKYSGVLLGFCPDGRVIIVDVRRGRASSLEIENIIANTAARDGFSVEGWIEQEGGSGGKAWPENIIRTRLQGFNYHKQPIRENKIDRSKPLSAQAENGNVFIYRPNGEEQEWEEPYLMEMCNFPTKGHHDDDVDATTGAYSKGVQILQPFEVTDEKDTRSLIADAPIGVFGVEPVGIRGGDFFR